MTAVFGRFTSASLSRAAKLVMEKPFPEMLYHELGQHHCHHVIWLRTVYTVNVGHHRLD